MFTRQKCLDPEIGQLLPDALSSVLILPGREEDLEKFKRHIKFCRKCRDRMIDHSVETVMLPVLEKEMQKIAEKTSKTVQETKRWFGKEVREMARDGRLEKLLKKQRWCLGHRAHLLRVLRKGARLG